MTTPAARERAQARTDLLLASVAAWILLVAMGHAATEMCGPAGWCVGSCWPLMLLPVVVPHSATATIAAMLAVMAWFVAERLDPPQHPAWGLHVPHTAARLTVARFTPSRAQRQPHVREAA